MAKKKASPRKGAKKPAAKKAVARKPAAKASSRKVATYTPKPVAAIGWARFRYPLPLI